MTATLRKTGSMKNPISNETRDAFARQADALFGRRRTAPGIGLGARVIAVVAIDGALAGKKQQRLDAVCLNVLI
jgi:hypothetical protein